jgi:membrane protein involved in colicin uptake
VYGNANVVQDTEGLSVYRSLKPGNSGHPLTDQQWWFKIIDMSSIKALYDQMVEGNNTMAEHELERVAAEQSRVSAEQSRVNAENSRIYNENQRINDETTRVRAEQDRITQENQRISQEQGRVGAEQQRVTKEQQRVSQEASRVAAETQRQLNENDRQSVFANDHAVAVADHQQADQDHTRAESDHETAVQDNAQMTELVERADADHVLAGQDHTRAESDHNTAASDHTQAGSDHTTATADHTQAGSDHTRAEADHGIAADDHQQAVQDHETLAPTVAEHTQQIAELGTGKQAVITDLATIAMGSGVSHDDTYSNIRTSTIANFILLTNAKVDILFTTPINAADATLNVSTTGAKPLHILGQALPAGVVKAQTYATMVYDGTAWNIVNLFCPGAEYDPAGLVVDMGLPSGVKWAARDIDLTKPSGFCDTPFTYMKSFFSWGNIDGHNPISNSAFDYNWGGVNEQEPYYDGQPYGDTPGNTLTGNIAVGEDFDAARANLGAPWRMPTNTEFGELFANIIYIDANGDEVDTTNTDKRVSVNGVMGLYIQSKLNGARLFFSCSGYGYGRSWSNRGSRGNYWSSAWLSARNARSLNFHSGGVNPQFNDNGRYYGFALRPVQ